MCMKNLAHSQDLPLPYLKHTQCRLFANLGSMSFRLESAPAFALQKAWLPELKKAVEEINKNFGHSFERIGCAGEVQLYEEADPETGLLDYDKFAMHIKVRFRAEEELQLLTAHRQSGGERSVATILYLIAIQVASQLH